MKNKKIIIATHNRDKLIEIKSKLNNLNFKVYSLFDYPEIKDIPETGKSLDENAIIKAKTVFDYTGIPALSDDTGLEVDALNGQPGVFSARWAGEDCSYNDNVNKMIKEIKPFSTDNRNAQFKTVMALVDHNVEHLERGCIKGQITDRPKGVGGFGYDPLFYIPSKGMTFAEMSEEEKSKISHRGLALKKMLNYLKKYNCS
ncbi:MAG: non-canonical purine NTP pyrophosphatase, RdgB/HAM1 family [Candidatus Marinimicrobia bacterium]|nr:non-canonical purine NTP pyrophosphatase, RdgB/HAM1 family [Candidatus Neomarinimicrobiota bacterium]